MISSLDLAKLCGVSQGTIDRALHNRGRISEKTRERILTIAKKHGYSPNPAAREILTGTSTLVGALVPGANSLFFMDLIEILRKRLRLVGLQLIIYPCSDLEEMETGARELAARRVRAICVISFGEPFQIPSGLSHTTFFGLVNPSKGKNLISCIPDETDTGRVGTEYLIQKGHKDILFVSSRSQSLPVVDRIRGYRASMHSHGLTARVLKNVNEKELLKALAKTKATALFYHNDWMALGSMRFLAEQGLNVPRDVSVLGVDNSPSFVSLYPNISTVQYPFSSVAAQVVAHLTGDTVPACEKCTVIERGSIQGV